jgi:hypothetical protein
LINKKLKEALISCSLVIMAFLMGSAAFLINSLYPLSKIFKLGDVIELKLFAHVEGDRTVKQT